MKNTLGNSKNKMCDKGKLSIYFWNLVLWQNWFSNEMVRRKTNKEQTFQLTSLAFAQFKPDKPQRCWLLATRPISTQNKCVVLLFRWVTKYRGFFLYDETMVHKSIKPSAYTALILKILKLFSDMWLLEATGSAKTLYKLQ